MTDNNRLTDLVARLRKLSIYFPHDDATAIKAADALEELMTVLKPFAEYADHYEWAITYKKNGETRVGVRLGDLRAARAALGEKE